MDEPIQSPPAVPAQLAPQPPSPLAEPTREALLAALVDALRNDDAALSMAVRVDGELHVAVRAAGGAIHVENRGLGGE